MKFGFFDRAHLLESGGVYSRKPYIDIEGCVCSGYGVQLCAKGKIFEAAQPSEFGGDFVLCGFRAG